MKDENITLKLSKSELFYLMLMLEKQIVKSEKNELSDEMMILNEINYMKNLDEKLTSALRKKGE